MRREVAVMDRVDQLKAFTTAELIEELRRRKEELEAGISLLTGSATPVRNSKMSEAKAAYWQAWHEYKAAHPDATVEQWRRAQKRSTKK